MNSTNKNWFEHKFGASVSVSCLKKLVWGARVYSRCAGRSGALSGAVRAVAFGLFDCGTCERSHALVVVVNLLLQRKNAVKLVWALDLREYKLLI